MLDAISALLLPLALSQTSSYGTHARTPTHHLDHTNHAMCQRDLILCAPTITNRWLTTHTHTCSARSRPCSTTMHDEHRQPVPSAVPLEQHTAVSPRPPLRLSPRLACRQYAVTFCGNVWNKRGASSPIARALMCVHACVYVRGSTVYMLARQARAPQPLLPEEEEERAQPATQRMCPRWRRRAVCRRPKRHTIERDVVVWCCGIHVSHERPDTGVLLVDTSRAQKSHSQPRYTAVETTAGSGVLSCPSAVNTTRAPVDGAYWLTATCQLMQCATQYTEVTGVAEGTPCVFPFKDNGIMHASCVTDDPWGTPPFCATAV
jgi:hypothetical protein